MLHRWQSDNVETNQNSLLVNGVGGHLLPLLCTCAIPDFCWRWAWELVECLFIIVKCNLVPRANISFSGTVTNTFWNQGKKYLSRNQNSNITKVIYCLWRRDIGVIGGIIKVHKAKALKEYKFRLRQWRNFSCRNFSPVCRK